MLMSSSNSLRLFMSHLDRELSQFIPDVPNYQFGKKQKRIFVVLGHEASQQ